MYKYLLMTSCLPVVALLFLPTRAQAGSCGTKATSYTVNVGNVVVRRDTAVNATIVSNVEGNSAQAYGNCTGYDGGDNDVVGSKTYLANNGTGVFPSNVAGIGLRIGAHGGFGGPSGCSYGDYSRYIPAGSTQRDACAINGAGFENNGGWIQPYVSLVKTSNITPGPLSGQIGAIYGGNASQGWLPEIPVYITGTVSVVGCSVSNTNINIPLGDHKPAEFTSVGYGSAWKNFDVPIECDPNTRVFFRVDATKDASNAPGVMKLDTASNVATGVGVQVYYNGTANPVVFGQSSEYKTSAGGADAIKLTARYYQTAAAVTAGDANATATFTLSYQ